MGPTGRPARQRGISAPWFFCLLLLLTPLGTAGLVVADETPRAPGLPFPIVFAQIPVEAAMRATPARFGEEARLVVLEPGGAMRLLTTGFQSACDPCVSFDGKRLLFAGKRAATEPWNIFEIAIDGSGLRQITREPTDCRSPIYLAGLYEMTETEPRPQIALVRSEGSGIAEIGGGPLRALCRCRPDGTRLERITYNLSSDLDSWVMWDGRLLYASTRPAIPREEPVARVPILSINIDGTDPAPFCAAAGLPIKRMPCTTWRQAVFVESVRPSWDGAGRLAAVALRRPLHSYREITADRDGRFHSPSPLSGDEILVSRRPDDDSATHAVYRFDLASGRRQLVFDHPNYHDIQPRRIGPREVPDGRSTAVEPGNPLGKVYCLNVYASDQRQTLPPGTVKRIRLVEGLVRQADRSPSPSALRRVMGEAPLAADGSFNFEVPANTPLELQLLDGEGMTLRSCSWVWARNSHSQGCIGCHEDPERTPTNWQPQALWQTSLPLHPAVEQRSSVDFRRDVLPIVARRCLACHDRAGSPPRLVEDAKSDNGIEARPVYDALLATDGAGKYRYVDPGRARTSPLVWHFMGRNTSQSWDGAAVRQAWKPIPAGSAEPLSAAERQTLLRWIDLGAAWQSPSATAGATKQ